MKKKSILLLFLSVCLYAGLSAQTHYKPGKDTLMYYMDYGDNIVQDKTNAQQLMIIMPGDSSTGVNLYPVAEYYMNGKPKLFAYSKTKDYRLLVFEGPYVSYDQEGHKEKIMNFSNGIRKGNLTLYLPNNKVYADEFYKDDGDLLYINCWDANGNALAKDGNGLWVVYTADFKHVSRKGMIKDSLEEGTWYENFGYKDDTTIFSKGKVISSTAKCRQLNVCVDPLKEAEFIGDFGAYLTHNMHYPPKAKKKNQQGEVIVQIIVDKDGSLPYVYVVKSSGIKSLDDEVVRVLKISPKWKPAFNNNKPVRCMFTVPISFTLSGEE